MSTRSSRLDEGAEERNTHERSAGTGSAPGNATGGVEPRGKMGSEIRDDEHTESDGRPQGGESGSHGSGSGIEGGAMQSDRAASRGQSGENQGERGGHGS